MFATSEQLDFSAQQAWELIQIKTRFPQTLKMHHRNCPIEDAMSTTTENLSDRTQKQPAAPAGKSSTRSVDKYVIGLLLLGFAALVTYQAVFCATCYGTSIH
jgi:hypothetical protein